jgi:hypothetical protein
MNALRLTPIFICALLLAAHFSRADNLPMLVFSLAAPAILLLRRPWVARAVQIALVLGALEWVRTLVIIAGRRQEAGEPWTRMAIILGTVALVTVLSALVFRAKGLKERYSL